MKIAAHTRKLQMARGGLQGLDAEMQVIRDSVPPEVK